MYTNTVKVRRMANAIPTECVSWRWNGNLGDDMIYAAQEAMFQGTLKLGQYIESPAAVVIGGGTFVPKHLHHPDLIDLSRRHPTAFFGTGIGDDLFWGRDHIRDWMEVIQNARFVGVRGPLSKERLESWGVPSDRVEWIGDPALYFADNQGSPRRFERKIAVNLGVTYGQLYGFDEEGLERTIIETLRQLVRDRWQVTLVSAWKPDDVVLDRIQAHVAVSAVEHWYDDYPKALESVKQFDIVLCEKLHVGVVAACRSVPFVALNYRSKVMDFCRSIAWEPFCVSTERVEPSDIIARIGTLAGSHEAYTNQLCKNVALTRERLLRAVPRTASALQMGAS